MSTYDPTKLVEHYRTQATRGLESGSRDVQADMQATRQHGDITGATRASYRAYVVGPDIDESQAVSSALSAVGNLNPGAEAVQDYTLPANTLGVIITGFTSYLPDLQTDNAGRKGILAPTLFQWAPVLLQSAAEGK